MPECKCALYGEDECEVHEKTPPRFFVEHDTVHDRKYGRHVTLPPLHNELVKRVLSSAYHKPMPGHPDMATEAFALAQLLCAAFVTDSMTISSLREWLASWGDGPNWSDPSGLTVPITKMSLEHLFSVIESTRATLKQALDKLP